MNITKSVKLFILAFSSCMFTYQTLITIHNLRSPPVVDSTERLNIEDVDSLMVTICPLNQWNISKLKEFGYEDEFYLLLGFANESKAFVGSGAQHNLTFEQLFQKVKNFNLSNPKIMSSVNGMIEENISTELIFYPKFGLCYELVNLTVTKNIFLTIRVNTQEGENVPTQVLITDKRLRTRHTVHTESHWGSSIVIEQGMDYSYLIKVEQISNFDPQTPADCKTYDEEEFDQCSDEELQQIWKPLINCNPPWVSSNNHCIGELNLTRKIAESMFDNSYVPVASIYEMVTYLKKDICIKACNVTQASISPSEKKKSRYATASNQTYLRLNFASEVLYTTKKFAYGPSEFLIDMGSSLGLWFGLSVFGITDLCIIAFQWLKKMRIKIMRKYLI